MNKPLAYIIDLDGTLYDNSHRQHLIPVDRSNTAGWVAFNSACAEDGLREDMADLVRSILLSGREVIFLTGRGESAREPTMQRLLKDFNFIEQPTLIMRPMDWHTSAAEFKRNAVERIMFSKRWAPYRLIALEDDPSVVEVMRSMGVTVLQIDSKCCALQDSNEPAGSATFINCSATDEAPAHHFIPAQVDTAPAQFESLAGNYPVTPEGWKLVPAEPTEEMLMAAGANCQDALDYLRDAYKEMMAAAPKQPMAGISTSLNGSPEYGWVVTCDGKDYFYRNQADALMHINTTIESSSRMASVIAMTSSLLQQGGGVHAKNEPNKLIGAGDITYGGAGDNLASCGSSAKYCGGQAPRKGEK